MNNNNSYKKIIFIENIEYNKLFNNFNYNDRDTLFICTTPETIEWATNNKINFTTPSQLYDYEDLLNEIRKSYIPVSDFLNNLENKIKNNVGDIDYLYCFKYSFHLLYDTIKAHIYIIVKIIERFNPEEILFIYYNEENVLIDDFLNTNDKKNLWYGFALCILRNYKYKSRKYHKITINDCKEKLNKKSILNPRRNDKYFRIGINIKKKLWWLKNKIIEILNDSVLYKKNVLFSNDFSWRYCKYKLMLNGYKLHFIDSLHKKIEQLYLDDFIDKKNFLDFILKKNEIFQVCNIYFFDVFKKILYILVCRYKNYLKCCDYIQNYIKQSKIRAIILSYYQTPPTGFTLSLITLIAQKCNVPIICWQHGGGLGMINYQPYEELVESDMSDYLFVWGEGIKTNIAGKIKTYKDNIFSVGSTRINRTFYIKKKIKEKYILVLFKNFFLNNYNQYWEDEDFRDDNLWILQKQIIDVMKKNIKETKVIIKLYSNFKMIALFSNYCKKINFENVKILSNECDSDILIRNADFFVVDFISTTFCEASITNKIIFYISKMKLLNNFVIDLNKRAYYCKTADEFEFELKNYLCNGSRFNIEDFKNFNYKYFNTKEINIDIKTPIEKVNYILRGKNAEKSI